MTDDFVLDVYIDESYDEDVFVLSLCSAHPRTWRNFQIFWQAHLDGLNARLQALNRPAVSRYHATDCANRKREFADWTWEEQVAITAELIGVIQCCPLHCVSMCVLLSDLREASAEVLGVPMAKSSLRKAAYMIAAQMAADPLVDYVHRLNPQAMFRFIYDQGPDEAQLLDAVKHLQSVAAERFGAIIYLTPQDSRYCLPLQLADFLAYESFKERRREEFRPNVPRNMSLRTLLADGLGYSLRTVHKGFIIEMMRHNRDELNRQRKP